ncbi:MAG: hypothetical protein PHV18_11565 [Lachnospiraceae bacterium]|nr:hypothetical protein [Lachnospiraceae bacterium]
MKKIRISFCTLLLMLTMISLVGCGSTNKSGESRGTTQTESSSGQSSSSGGGTETTTGGSRGNVGESGSGNGTGESGSTGAGGSAREESSTGVIDGLMNDVEKGAEDLTGNRSLAPADESR